MSDKHWRKKLVYDRFWKRRRSCEKKKKKCGQYACDEVRK